MNYFSEIYSAPSPNCPAHSQIDVQHNTRQKVGIGINGVPENVFKKSEESTSSESPSVVAMSPFA
jgi:hypothetical protein